MPWLVGWGGGEVRVQRGQTQYRKNRDTIHPNFVNPRTSTLVDRCRQDRDKPQGKRHSRDSGTEEANDLPASGHRNLNISHQEEREEDYTDIGEDVDKADKDKQSLLIYTPSRIIVPWAWQITLKCKGENAHDSPKGDDAEKNIAC